MATATRARRPGYECHSCGHQPTKWVGRCPNCGEWGTVEQRQPAAGPDRQALLPAVTSGPARRITEIDPDSARARGTGVPELDRVLGAGLVPGAVVLLAGEPGAGKSTLLLEVGSRWAATHAAALYVTGEESAGQVRLRAERTEAAHPELYLAAAADLGAIAAHVDEVKPSLLLVDSVQTLYSSSAEGSPGGVTQVRAATTALTTLAKERGLPVVLVGHVTKEGAVAGPRMLEHLVDVVLHFEGDRNSTLRLLRGVKNRFGPADEVGCFELAETGITGVTDPSGLFLRQHADPVAGTATTVVTEGKRALPAEVQALVSPSTLSMPRRAVSGLDSSRVAMLLAVLERRTGLTLAKSDVFTATVGGMRITEPAADLALALAVASAEWDRPVPSGMTAIGEIGLAGELRPVPGIGRRLAEAARLGWRVAMVPAGTPSVDGEAEGRLRLLRVPDLPTALQGGLG